MVSVHSSRRPSYGALSKGGWCSSVAAVHETSPAVKAALTAHIDRVLEQHQTDLRHGAGWVELPGALMRKYPNADRDWGWQWVFPATRIYDVELLTLLGIVVPRSGARGVRAGRFERWSPGRVN
jgi:hypothetical protein